MADSGGFIDDITTAQGGKETTANEGLDTTSSAAAFAYRASTSASLTWGFYGSHGWRVDGVHTPKANGTLALTASVTRYVEVDRDGVVSYSATKTAGKRQTHEVTTGASSVSSFKDLRPFKPFKARVSKALSDADYTLTADESLGDSLAFTGTLTAGRNIVVPTVPEVYTVYNGTTGGFALTVKTAAGTGVAVATGVRALVECDGTNVVLLAQSTSSYVLPTASGSTLGGVKVGNGLSIDGGGILSDTEAVNAQTGTSYTYVSGDWGKLVTHSNASAIAGSLPQAGASFPNGWHMDVLNMGAGTLTITPSTSTIDGGASLSLTTGQGVTIVSDGTNYFSLRGAGGYTLPTASTTVLGGVKIDGTTITIASGVISASGSSPSTSSLTDFAQDTGTTTGLTYGYKAGRIRDGTTITNVAAGTIAMTASTTNYVEVSGAGTVSTNTTGFTAGRYPMATVTTDGSSITGVTDKRGVIRVGLELGLVQVFTKNQSVSPNGLTDGATISVDASLSNNFKVTIAGNRTLANPTNMTDGMVLNFRIKQDATGSRTLAYGTKYKFPGGTAPVLSTAANAVDFMSCYYDSTDDTLACVMSKGFA